MSTAHSAILVLGRDGPSEETLETVEGFDEVFVVERAVPDPADHYIVDEEAAYADARLRLATVLARLHTGGVEATGIVGDPDPESAVLDARAIFPDADEIVAEAEPDPQEGYDRPTKPFEGKYLSLTSFKRDAMRADAYAARPSTQRRPSSQTASAHGSSDCSRRSTESTG
jgi:hypothetical protein